MKPTLKFIQTEIAKQLSEELELSFVPTKGTDLSSAYDFRAAIPNVIEIKVDEVVKISTGIKVDLVSASEEAGVKLCLLIMPRSGVAKGLRLENTIGLIDTDYQGEIFCKWRNSGNAPVVISPGERMVQGIITLSFDVDFEETEAFEQETVRSEGGFGSTGVN